ncbi:endonuclease Q family protein [Paenibacillus alginolyticus]|uniref:Endonuclease Q family protein n=1 Tax=Paenibacillus alginolyticus TaxID=59839 RepID=A0ABT4GD32_9BACL|nr:endonuclease Q family protein [Paenibacillus alginolyticus]MCY9664790.1 endonuclease Q family protein [Paenibacillus alginolyticus]MCY9694108.1 endonuclease Q family protein [Paenibacillus alginolyticus]MEC0143566.1 endonuclease Q family protein [Paenibacillus alginolyticus]
MKSYYVDLHIHIGRTEKGQAVKISAANDLTFFNIAKEATVRKGMEIIGIIDCHSPSVQDDIMTYLDRGEMVELEGGGIRYLDTTIMLGCEIEVRDPGMGPAHLLAYMPNLKVMQGFTQWMKGHMKNVELSSQRIYVPARELQDEVLGRGGILIPAHIFTPHKSVYGSATSKMEYLLDLKGISAVELGLSADSEMAGLISELDAFTFVTNSDAHSLGKIGREYNEMKLAAPTYEELVKALHRQDERGIIANYGLNPRLGKYHRTYCSLCESVLDESETTTQRCADCGSNKIVRGVMDRIQHLADRELPYLPPYRPPYHFQVPLEFIPGLGPKKLDQLLRRFGTEMNVLHRTTRDELASEVGEEIAAYIVKAREGSLQLEVGGGGRYGKVKNRS